MAPKKKPAMSGRLSMCARTLHQLGNVPVADMMDVNNYPNLSRFSRATLFRHAKNLLDEDVYDLRHQNKGRPCLTTKQGLRDKGQTNVLSESSRSFSAIDLQKSCGMSSRVSAVTFRRALNSLGYNYPNTRRQGMLLKKDVKRDVLAAERQFDTTCYHITFAVLDFPCMWMGLNLSTNPTHMSMQNV